MTIIRRSNAVGRSQSGAVLAITLIMLLLLTLIGVTSMQGTALEERMAGNVRDANLAFQAGEAGLRSGEALLAQLQERPDLQDTLCSAASPCPGVVVYAAGILPPDLHRPAENPAGWWAGAAFTYSEAMQAIPTLPRFLIEHRHFVRDNLNIGHEPVTGRDIYTVSTRATGQTADAQVVLQSTYSRRFD